MTEPKTNTSANERERSNADDFIALAVKIGALQLGEFKLKSGRISPYFFNSNAFYTGGGLRALATFYAAAINRYADDHADNFAFDALFGLAYKGIPLLGALGGALGEHRPLCRLSYNRKEPKTHGEGGQANGVISGAPLEGRVLIIDDVITAGTAVREAIVLIRDAGATPAGIAVCFDRCEKGAGEHSTIRDLENEFDLPVIRIATFHNLREHAQSRPELSQFLSELDAYRRQWGVD